MAKRQFKLTDQQEKELQRAFSNMKDGATRIRYQAVRLYGRGYPVHEIGQITGCSRTSLMEWCAKYREHGLEGLADHRGGPHRARLTATQVEEVAEKLRQYKPYDLFGPQAHTGSGQHWTVEDLARAIEQWYGVTWKSRSSYRDLFAQCGFSYQRTEKVYKSRRERDVMDFEELVEKN
ncbi:MAG: helix-turn-helix domain-containing protein [Chloroflexota bacterium]|jgi:transposase